MKCPRCGHEPMVECKYGNNKYGCLKCAYVIRRDGTIIDGCDLNTAIQIVMEKSKEEGR